jgi:hypothetical protein
MLRYPEYLTAYTDGIAKILEYNADQAPNLFGLICRALMTYPTTHERNAELVRFVNIGGIQRLRSREPICSLLASDTYRTNLLDSLRRLSNGLVIQQEILADLFPDVGATTTP